MNLRPLDVISNNMEKKACNINVKESTVLKIVHHKKTLYIDILSIYTYVR